MTTTESLTFFVHQICFVPVHSYLLPVRTPHLTLGSPRRWWKPRADLWNERPPPNMPNLVPPMNGPLGWSWRSLDALGWSRWKMDHVLKRFSLGMDELIEVRHSVLRLCFPTKSDWTSSSSNINASCQTGCTPAWSCKVGWNISSLGEFFNLKSNLEPQKNTSSGSLLGRGKDRLVPGKWM